MSDVCFDIETMPNSYWVERMPEPEVALGNLKDVDKIREKVAAAKVAQIAKMALSPLYGRVCAFVCDGSEDSNGVIVEDSDAAETEIIERAFFALSGEKIITYNGNNFDLPFLYRRAALLGVNPQQFGMPTLAELTARYNNKHHIDVMNVWCGYGNYEKLDALALAFGIKGKIEIDFHKFPELIKTPEGSREIFIYCAQDVKILRNIWTRICGTLV